MLKPKSLQQRLVFFLLAPLAVLMFGMGTAAFVYATSKMLDEWKVGATLKLERAAHYVDMRLSRAKELLLMYHDAAEAPYPLEAREWILDQIKELGGIARVDLAWSSEEAHHKIHPVRTREISRGDSHGTGAGNGGHHMPYYFDVMPPRYNPALNHETVSLVSELKGEDGATIGKIEVVIRLDYLMEDIVASSWRQGDKAFLVDKTGKILSCTSERGRHIDGGYPPLDHATIQALDEKRFGTILGKGYPPDEVTGFYRLHEAPWSLVVTAPGSEILAPIIHFATYYLLIGSTSILLVLLLIRTITASSVSMIKEVSRAANKVARGSYGDLLEVKSRDEVGQLVESFNSMVSQLEERMRLKEAMHVAMEVQQSLLPGGPPELSGLEIAGMSIYCDETGGDYYDFLQFSEMGEHRIGIAVGDVVGHGIGAALLMATVRASLRSRATQPGNLSRMISDVNRLLCIDTRETDSFMTLFFMLIDSEDREIRWVRAGHDPALVFNPSADSFEELRGEGIALGVDGKHIFPEYVYSEWTEGSIVVIGTDGIWETENPRKESFGKARLRKIIRQNSHRSAPEIVSAITDGLASFRETASQEDDITMVVVKILHTEGEDSQ